MIKIKLKPIKSKLRRPTIKRLSSEPIEEWIQKKLESLRNSDSN